MHFTSTYQSPIGEILLAADDIGIIGIWFKDAKYYARCLDKENEPKETPVIKKLKQWLDIYFQGKEPDFDLPVHMTGTSFQLEVWNILREIPYGTTVTYNEIAKKIAKSRGLERMSAQAVGTAVGKNSISLVVPCHRVVGANNSLAGYAGGIDKKIALLKLEGSFRNEFFIPKNSQIIADKELNMTLIDFINFLRNNKMTFEKAGGYWKNQQYFYVKYKNESVCYILVNGKDDEIKFNSLTVWTDDSNSSWYSNIKLEKSINSVAVKHIDYCEKCGACKGGTDKLIFGNNYNNVFRTTFRFINPNSEEINCLKQLILLRKNDIDSK